MYLRIFKALIIGLCIFTAQALSDNSVNLKIQKPATGLISLNFQNIKVRELLQLLAEIHSLNLIISDSVQSSVSIHLDKVSWNQAMMTLLNSQGLQRQKIGNIWVVSPIAELEAREKQQFQLERQLEQVAPLREKIISLHYAKAEEVAKILLAQAGSVLSTRGAVRFDARSNTLWVQDTANRLLLVKNFIQYLDKPAQQILIEARLVSIDSRYEKELGLKFNFRYQAGSGPALNMDLPAPEPQNLGLAWTQLSSSTELDLELAALESEGAAHIIASPRLITANGQAAQIESGQEIPYQEETSSGATNVAFKKAVLSLNVVPQVTSDQKVFLTLRVNQDRVNFGRLVLGVPPIDTQQIETRVLLQDGEMVVLGGIYQTDHSQQVQRVPFLSSLPILGALFRYTRVDNKRSELLIFITPHILKSLEHTRPDLSFNESFTEE